MATAAQIGSLMDVRKGDRRIWRIDRNFLGTRWTFVELRNGEAYWLWDATGRALRRRETVPSSRNQGRE